jgi:hypothetical protein
MHSPVRTTLLAAGLGVLLTCGCGAPAPEAAQGTADDHAHADHDAHAGHDHSAEAADAHAGHDHSGEDAPDAGGVETPDGTAYGKALEDAPTLAISELHSRIEEFDGKPVRVEGLVTDVCPRRGCWIELASDEEFQTLTFKVQDGVVVFPMGAKGKYAVAEGTARLMELDLEQTRNYKAHAAEEKGESFDPESVTEPMRVVRLDGSGAVLRDQR